MIDVTPDELDSRLQAETEDPLLLDIRHADDFEDWHIPGSENVDIYDELKNDRDEAAAQLRTLPQDREIVTVCAVGKMSAVATETLRDDGYEAKTLRDGMSGWSRVHRTARIDADLDGTLIQVARPGTGCLSYVLLSAGEAAVFDPSIHFGEYEVVIKDYDADLVGVFDTHAHADHVSGGQQLADRYGVPYHLHPADATDLEVSPLADGEQLSVGDVEIEVLHTPGHSPGSVSFGLDEAVLFTGDTLFHESVGRVELGVEAGLEDVAVEDNAAALYDGLQRLREYGDDPLVLPTHDPGSPDPPVTARMREVEERNAGLGRAREAFVDSLASDIPEHPPNFQQIKRVNVGVETLSRDDLEELEQGPNNCAAE
jgi:glyoxylase-like metal-dependent hydrolase (beta-lactamase superfamily II)